MFADRFGAEALLAAAFDLDPDFQPAGGPVDLDRIEWDSPAR